MPDLATAYTLADLVGPDLLGQYLGDGLESVADSLVVLPDSRHAGAWQLAIVVDGSVPLIPLVGEALQLDLSALAGGGSSGVDAIVIADVSFSINPVTVTVTPLPGIQIRVSPDLLTPLNGTDAVRFQFLPGVDIKFSAAGVSYAARSLPTLVLPPCAVGPTGVQIQGGAVNLALWGTNGDATLLALGVDDSFRGVVFQNLRFSFASSTPGGGLAGLDGTQLTFPLVALSRAGISGTAEITFAAGTAAASFFGASISPQKLSLSIGQTSITRAALACSLTLPFFDQPVDAIVSLSDGAWSLGLSGANVVLQGPGFALNLTALGIEQRDSDTWFKLSGTLTPRAAGYDFPALDLKDVLIDRNGHIKAAGGAMALSSQKTFKFGDVLTAKLTKFGFGSDGADGRFIALSGGISLIEGIPLEAQFDNLRVSWSAQGGNGTMSLAGANIDLGIPGLFTFAGSLAFIDDTDASGNREKGFGGSVHLSIEPAQLEVDGFLKVLEVSMHGKTFTALGIELDLQLPAAIPLMQTNLGIYGFNGLIAWHYGPSLSSYSNDWFLWFMGRKSGQPDQIGVTGQSFITKWGPDYDKKGAGAGFTLGTMVDLGFSWHARTTFIILVPGPDLILTGECNFISKQPGLKDNVSGAFQVLVAYDGNAETLNAAIAAKVGKDPIFYAAGAANAFFDFNDPEAWYLDVGTKAIPIRANVAKILNGTAYLDLSSNELDAGAQAGYSESFHAGPLSATARAHVGFDATLTRRPLRLHGKASLTGTLAMHAWKIGATIALDAKLDMDAMVLAGPAPGNIAYKFHFDVNAELHAKVLFVSKDISETFHVDIKSAQDPDAPDPPAYPLTGISLELPAHTAETWPLPITHVQTTPAVLREDAIAPPPTPAHGVPPDSLPTLVFGVPVHDQNSIGSNPALHGTVQIGNASYAYTLQSIVITDQSGGVVYSSKASDQAAPVNALPVWGRWCEELGAAGKTRLQLFADTPYFLSMRTTEANRLADSAAIRGPSPCAGVSATTLGTCVSSCDFPRISLDDGSADLVMAGASASGFVFRVAGPRLWGRKSSPILTVGSPAVCWIVAEPGDSIGLPFAAALIRIQALTVDLSPPWPGQLDPTAVPPTSAFSVYDAAGNPRTVVTRRTETPDGAQFDIAVASADAVRVDVACALAISRICVFTSRDAAIVSNADALNEQEEQALEAGASGNQLHSPFKPWSTYTLTVAVEVAGAGGSGTFVDRVGFTTGGPPGVLTAGANANASWTSKSYPIGGPLVDLQRYAAASCPQDDSNRAAPFDNPYRGYDASVVFDEGYLVDLYNAADAPLVLDVIDRNGASLVGTSNGLLASRGGKRSGRSNRFRQLWASRLSRQCGIGQSYPPDDELVVTMNPRTALLARRQYDLRVTAGTDGSGDARVVLDRTFCSSRFLTLTHHFLSHPDAVFPLALDRRAVLARLRQVAALAPFTASDITEAEADLYDTVIAALKLPTPAPRDWLDGNALWGHDGKCHALLFAGPEPLPWDRVSIGDSRFAPVDSSFPRPGGVSITDIRVDRRGAGYVEMMLREDGDPSGIALVLSDGTTCHQFRNEGIWPSGTLLRVVCGRPVNDTSPDYRERAGAVARFPRRRFGVTARRGKATLHERSWLPPANYRSFPFRLARKRDGSAFILIGLDARGAPAPFRPGYLKLSLSLARDLSSDGDPNGFRLWSRGGISTPETATWNVRIPPSSARLGRPHAPGGASLYRFFPLPTPPKLP